MMKTPPRRPVLAEPDQKYWRRKANRQVRKQRLTRKLMRWTGIFLANALIAGGLVIAGLEASAKLLGGPEFAIDGIRVERTRRASAERIEQRLLRAYADRNIFSVNLYEIEQLAMRDPWVRTASVKRVLPGTIRVRVIERAPVAVALIEGVAHLVDTEGYVIGLTGSGADDLPVLTGLGDLEGDALAAALSRGVLILERLHIRAPLFAQRLSELDLSEQGAIVAYTLGDGPRLLLDPETVERNVNRWLDLALAIRHRAGPLDYVDLRWSQRIAVKPSRP